MHTHTHTHTLSLSLSLSLPQLMRIEEELGDQCYYAGENFRCPLQK